MYIRGMYMLDGEYACSICFKTLKKGKVLYNMRIFAIITIYETQP